MLEAEVIVEKFLETKMQVHPEVVRFIREHNDPSIIEKIISSIPHDTIVVSVNHIPAISGECDGARFNSDPYVDVITGLGGTQGSTNIENYLHLFRDRYQKLGGIIKNRFNSMPIEGLTRSNRYFNVECSIIGMTGEIRNTTNGHRLIELEDNTGKISVLFNKNNSGFEEAEVIVPDEVIGVRGTLSGDGRIFFADTMHRPDIPHNNAPFKSKTPGKAVLISDIHVGSNTFLEGAWNSFLDWLCNSDVSYLLVAGDLVDGIGIYPGQEHELCIPNIYDQYARLGEMFCSVPKRIKVILSPGNHDVVRGAEPQPAIPEEFRKKFPDNCTFVENPSIVSLQGVRILIYHGRSIDDLIGLIPGASYQKGGEMMEAMLKRRHLAPIYGRKTPIAANYDDALIINPIPDVIHTGHIHISSTTEYRGVIGINAGTWQSQTAFQKQMNIQPTPGKAVVLDLPTLSYDLLDFN